MGELGAIQQDLRGVVNPDEDQHHRPGRAVGRCHATVADVDTDCELAEGALRDISRCPGLNYLGLYKGVVFPEADLKIFLTASPDERALRRYKQLKDKGSDVSLPALSREITERDQRDSTRSVAPLKPAPDAEVIDSTSLSIEQVIDRVIALGRARKIF